MRTPSLRGERAQAIVRDQQAVGDAADRVGPAVVRVERIGTTSVTYDHAAYRADDDMLMATAKQTLVLIDLVQAYFVEGSGTFLLFHSAGRSGGRGAD